MDNEIGLTDKNPKIQGSIINDFCMTICTVNGSGSATANLTLLRSLFHMGIPVSGKNIFPSNIKGLPTWFSIRVSKDGYLARVAHDDIIVQMNPMTFEEDMKYNISGGVVFYADHIDMSIDREDVIVYPMPVKDLIEEADVPRNLREYMQNMVYVGIVSQMLGIKLEVVHEVLLNQFKKKTSVAESNFAVVKLAADWARDNLVKKDKYQVQEMPPLDGYIMTDGNTAGALGAIYGGFQFCGWYPITPATSLAESLNIFAPKLRKDPETGKNNFAIIQAEDELASIGMAVGAGWAGLRAMTSTSGPGISLMTEYMSLAYFAEVPVVVWDVQRVGPSTGLPTRTGQGDLILNYFLGHGDTQQIIIIPSTVTECFDFGWKAFDFADQFQTPVIILSDLDLGMNFWMTKEFEYPDKPINKGKILWEEDLEAFGKEWGRYLDVDGDGIPYRTVMGNSHEKAAYFARGTGHDEFGNYSEDPEVWRRNLDRIKLKIENAREILPEPIIRKNQDARIGLIGMGSTEPAILEAQDKLLEKGISADFMRIRALPLSGMVKDFIKSHDRNYVIELNRDGQLHKILNIDYCYQSDRLVSLSYIDGLPMPADYIIQSVSEKEQNQNV
jgi:2-oxoglutarate ferredoxin oxidoreductase subunit alpha